MIALEKTLTHQGEMWAGGEYELMAQRFAPVHDELSDRLAASPGELWLDVATGSGGIALRAAKAGAEVTGVDISAGLLRQAGAKAAGEGLELRLDLGDAQRLPYPDGSFDVVSSCFGVVFASDQEAVAGELGRVCRRGAGSVSPPGGRSRR